MTTIGYDLGALLAEERNLDRAKAALVREGAIRHIMALSGESRQIVAEMVDAHTSMGHEAVLELTDGEPTTLKDALRRYVEALEASDDPLPLSIEEDLRAMLEYPWPGER